MKIRIISLLLVMTAWTAFCQIGRVSNITCDIARNSTYSCRFTSMMDGAVTANILYNSSDFDVSGWTGLFFIGDGRGGMVVTNTAIGFSSFTFAIPVSSIPTNGTYYSQLIGYKNGRIEEWGRGIVVVENNYSDGTLPTEWIREHPIYQIATQALNVANSAYQLVAGQSNMFWAIVGSIPAGSITSNDVTRWNQAYASSTNMINVIGTLATKQQINDISDSLSTQRITRIYNSTNFSEWYEIRGSEKLTYTVTQSTFYHVDISETLVDGQVDSEAASANFYDIPPLKQGVWSFNNSNYELRITTNDLIIVEVYKNGSPFYERYLPNTDFSPSSFSLYNVYGFTGSVVFTLTNLATTNVTSEIMAYKSDLGLFRDSATNVVWRKVVSNGWEYLVAHTNYVGGAQ